MKTLEIIVPFYDSVEVSIDNHLVGLVNNWDNMWEEHQVGIFSFPLPEGNWRVLEEIGDKIIIGDFS